MDVYFGVCPSLSIKLYIINMVVRILHEMADDASHICYHDEICRFERLETLLSWFQGWRSAFEWRFEKSEVMSIMTQN